MTCEEVSDSISAYVDDELSAGARRACDAHFDFCPLCRVELAETRVIARRVAASPLPDAPADLATAINNRVHTERAVLARAGRSNADAPAPWFAPRVFGWLVPRAFSFSVGAVASVILFVLVLGALFPAMRALHVIEQAALLDANLYMANGGYDVTKPITAEDYVASRTPFTSFSPSLDPQGALAVASAPDASAEASTEEDDMLIVADVFSDGQASLAGVVTPPRDARMLSDLEAALRRTPAFVPSRLDHRPPTMRVVFMVQRMNVRETVY